MWTNSKHFTLYFINITFNLELKEEKELNNLIKVTEKDGKQLLSAKELYLGLGLNKTNWSRWYPTNIENNGYFEEEVDWMGVRHDDEGNETMDFAITIDFAKHIAMMARTEKSHEYRNYFIACEKRLKESKKKQLSPMDQLRLQYQVIEQHEEKINFIENKVNYLENNMVIEHGQEVTVKKAVDKQVIKVCYGSESPAYSEKDLRNRVYRSLWKDYKEYFNIVSYHDTLKKDIDKALELIKSWKPSGGLLRDIQMINTQLSM